MTDRRFAQALEAFDAAGDLAPLLDALGGANPSQWLEGAQALMLRRAAAASAALLDAAVAAHPGAVEIRYALAGTCMQLGRPERAEELLRSLLSGQPDHLAARFLLARVLRNQGRIGAMADLWRDACRYIADDAESLIRAVEMLDEAGRQEQAAYLCEQAIMAGSVDPRLHAYAGMLLSQLGRFEDARTRQLFALSHSEQAVDWHVPLGLAGQQRYAQPDHPDFALFERLLHRPALTGHARAGLLFALGKANDDIGDYAQAARHLHEANALVHSQVRWSRKLWRRGIEARLARQSPKLTVPAPADWTPVFVVGVPRSGTTLLTERLARRRQVCHRGELAWMPTLATSLDDGGVDDAAGIAEAASHYARQLRQDDAPHAHWFIDKQPFNFLHVDRILALFPNARFLHCRRRARDTAVSLWMQSFQHGMQDYAYDLMDIAAVLQGERRLMAHWHERYPQAILTVDYEALAADPDAVVNDAADWLGLPPGQNAPGPEHPASSISTASLWQARQPVHTRSIERWRHYAPYLPGLSRLPAE